MKTYLTDKEKKKAVLAFINLNKENAEECLDELSRLVKADDIEVAGSLVQNISNRSDINAATLIGRGKLEELKELISEKQADIVVFDNELSGSQIKNIEDILNIPAVTRSMIILDIFAKRAATAESKKQVELAQLQYMKSRLTGSFAGNGKFGSGGVGTRGPGETKLELDRRKMKDRIIKLEAEIKEIETNRRTSIKARDKSKLKKVAIVGYTNAGKSTLMNYITKAGVFEKDMLFATLETTVRKVYLDTKTQIYLTDTVGFVSKLPHEFIKAFRSTLAEAALADVLVIVADSTSRHLLMELTVSKNVLEEIGAKGKTIIAINKIDNKNLNTAEIDIIKQNNSPVIEISAKTGKGVEQLKEILKKFI